MWLPFYIEVHCGGREIISACSMRKKKSKKESGQATRASVQEEMAKPRMAKSAREEVLKRSAGRITPAKRVMVKLQSHELPLPPHARQSGHYLRERDSLEKPFSESAESTARKTELG